MSKKVVIFHNPRCSKSRETLKLLEEKKIEPEVVLYLEKAPSKAKLESIAKMLGKQPLEFMRTKEARFKELGLSTSDKRSKAEWLAIMAENPVLIERPIVIVDGKKAALGRPPEDVRAIL